MTNEIREKAIEAALLAFLDASAGPGFFPDYASYWKGVLRADIEAYEWALAA